MVENSEEWEHIITEPTFLRYFSVKGETLKNVPSGYDKAHSQAEYLKIKRENYFPNLTIESVNVFDIVCFCKEEKYDELTDYLMKAIDNLIKSAIPLVSIFDF